MIDATEKTIDLGQVFFRHELDRPFCSDVTYEQLYSMAAKLLESMSEVDGPVCFASPDRLLCAVALLAALAGRKELVLPHGFSSPVLKEAKDVYDYAALLGPGAQAPKGVEVLPIPEPHNLPQSWSHLHVLRKADEALVHMFTGGSTGKPRVWSKTVANVLGEASYMCKRFAFGPGDFFLSTMPVQHIYGFLFSVVAPLLVGARVVRDTAYFPAEIVEILSGKHPTVFISGPVHYRLLRQGTLHLPALRLATSSGGMLDPADGERFFHDTGIGVTEIYGSTETGGLAFRNRAEGEKYWTPLDLVKWKTQGERLCVLSPFLSMKIPTDDDGFFVTADRVRPADPGKFLLLGRMDGVVKVAGERVDLMEVEQKIRTLDQVLDAHVLSVPSAKRGREIVAMVVTECTTGELVRLLRDLMEPYALPRRFVKVDKIPRTEAGKPDREEILRLVETRPH